MQNRKLDNPQGDSLARRAMGDIVLAEFFLIQATLESAAAIENGLTEIGRHFREDGDQQPLERVGALLKRTREQAIEPYSTRLKYLRNLVGKDLAA